MPLERPNVVMTNPSIGRNLLRIGKGRIGLDYRGRDLDHPNIKTQKEVLNSSIRPEVCTGRIFRLNVGTDQLSK
jgi:hypothetical protein